jgi:hypothetical protein
MAHEAAQPRPSQSFDASPVIATLPTRPQNDNGKARPDHRRVYCPPAPADGQVYRTFRQLFWGAAHLVLVAPPTAEGSR